MSKTAKCTLPLRGVFAAASLLVIAAFALVAALGDILFTTAITHAVDTEIEIVMRQAMELITDPLDTSEQLVERLRDKIEMYPSIYAIDDADPTTLSGNPSSHMFVADAVMVGLQRPTISIFQVRQSSRFNHRPGQPMDTLLEINQLHVELASNNTAASFTLASKASLANLSAPLPTVIHPLNVSGTPHITKAYATNDLRWVVSAFGIPDLGIATTTMMTIYGRVRNTGGTLWAIGIDHNMSGFKELLLQGTAPFTFGTHNPNKVVEAGAHTSLYDMHDKAFVTTSLRNFRIYKGEDELWPAGETPHEQVNAAYRDAMGLCAEHHSCIDEPAVEIIDDHVISAFRVRREAFDLDLMIVSSAPRKYFFDEADKSLAVSIGVSVAACVLVMAGCVALLVCMRPALHHLQTNMLLASELQNDLVVHTDSVLTEIAELSSVFDEMNQRLLVARSFVPEAVLLGQESHESHEDEGSVTSYSVGRSTKNAHSNHSSLTGRNATTATSADTPTSVISSERIARLFVMSEKRVAVLSLNLVGFSGLLSTDSSGSPRPQRINDITARLLTIVVAAAQAEKGVLDSFHGDHFILTFNASRPVASALAAAVRTSADIQGEVSEDPHFRGSLGVAAGASVGRAHVGTLGIDGHRRLSIICGAYRSAIGLQGVCAQYLQKSVGIRKNTMPSVAGCVLEQKSLVEVDSSSCGIYTQLLGSAAAPVNPKGKRTMVYAAHCQATGKHVNDEEWLYELDAIEAADPFLVPNRATMALLDGDMDACRQMLAGAPARNPSSNFHSISDMPDPLSLTPSFQDVFLGSITSGPTNHTQRRHPAWSVPDMYHQQAQAEEASKPWEYVLS